jgi:hypothetical protein
MPSVVVAAPPLVDSLPVIHVLANIGGIEVEVVELDDALTLRDSATGRIRLSYGDVLTIDATQGLTSTEHIQAMPAGTQAVTAFQAYTAASRHRRASYLVAPDGAERREIASRRPLGDLRPIREADVWANMTRNLERQPETPAALDLLDRAHRLQRGAARALQAGLRPAEQREAEGLAKTTLQHTWQRRRVVAHVAEMAERLGSVAKLQDATLEMLSRLGATVREVATKTMAVTQPVLRQAATQMRERQRHEVKQRHAQEHKPRLSRGPSLGILDSGSKLEASTCRSDYNVIPR